VAHAEECTGREASTLGGQWEGARGGFSPAAVLLYSLLPPRKARRRKLKAAGLIRRGLSRGTGQAGARRHAGGTAHARSGAFSLPVRGFHRERFNGRALCSRYGDTRRSIEMTMISRRVGAPSRCCAAGQGIVSGSRPRRSLAGCHTGQLEPFRAAVSSSKWLMRATIDHGGPWRSCRPGSGKRRGDRGEMPR